MAEHGRSLVLYQENWVNKSVHSYLWFIRVVKNVLTVCFLTANFHMCLHSCIKNIIFIKLSESSKNKKKTVVRITIEEHASSLCSLETMWSYYTKDHCPLQTPKKKQEISLKRLRYFLTYKVILAIHIGACSKESSWFNFSWQHISCQISENKIEFIKLYFIL